MVAAQRCGAGMIQKKPDTEMVGGELKMVTK